MQMKKIIALSILVSAFFFFTGCGATGAQFTGFAQPKQNQGLVYVYRPSGFVGSGVYYDIHVTNSTNPDLIAGELVNGSYVKVDVPKGKNEIWGKTEAKSSIMLDIKEGDIQCVKGSVGMGLFIGRPHLELVDMRICKSEIFSTRKAK